MDIAQKLALLADAAKYDASCASSGSYRKRTDKGLGNTEGMGICHSYTPDGRCVSLLKILFTNFCIYDCQYCVNRISSDVPRARFRVEEVVKLTLDFYRRNYIEGLFLSSGIIQSSDYTMEQLIRVAQILRQEHGFGGYIHLKAVAGASEEILKKAGRWADRLSVNIELPTEADLQKLAPEKTTASIEGSMDKIKLGIQEFKEERKLKRKIPSFAPAGQTTQMIVGATPSTDLEILGTADRLYRNFGLRRIYYSAYSPIPHASTLLGLPSPPLMREHRLYQADWLFRFYEFKVDEIVSAAEPELSLAHDPKLQWALRHREFFPVDLNRAPRESLLRVPGLGVRSVDRILQVRRHHHLRLEDLKKLKVPFQRVKYFVSVADANPNQRWLQDADLEKRFLPASQQLSLFSAEAEAQTGAL